MRIRPIQTICLALVVLVSLLASNQTWGDRMSASAASGPNVVRFPGVARDGDGAPSAVRAVEALDETTVRVTYARVMGPSAIDPANYTIKPASGEALAVVGAQFGSERNVVDLATAAQAGVSYQLTIANVQDTTGQQVLFDGRNFTGNPKGAVVSAGATSSTRVVVVFNEPVADNALAPQNYDIRNASGVRLSVSDVDFEGPLGMVVVLTTAPQASVMYTLTVSNVTDLGSDPLAAATRTATFQGLTASGLIRALPTDPTHLTLTFSGPVGDSALAPSTYVIDQLDAASTVVGKLQILSARFVGDQKTIVELTTNSQLSVRYRVSTNGALTDQAGNVLPAATILFDGISGQPSLSLVASTGPTTVLVTFNVPMSDDVLSPASYGISQLDDATKSLSVIRVAFVGGEHRVVELTTAPQGSVNYVVRRLSATNTNGIALVLPATPGVNLFTGNGSPNGTPAQEAAPRVVGAASLSNNQVIVAFSEPMSSSAIQIEHYVIVQENVNPEAGFLRVTAAGFYNNNPSTVLLTTTPQSELTYRVTVVNATDLSGTALAPKVTTNGVLVDPTSATFPGTPPIGGTDSDGDGLADNVEIRGWIVTVTSVDGTKSSRGVTSDPSVADSDGDGLGDAQEANLRFDPRTEDTDDDQIDDYAEFNEVYSNGLDQDSDNDTLDDFLEFTFFRTSPLFADTDGDQISDANEIIGNRNPRVSDLPRPEISIGAVNMQLDVKFTESNAQQRRDLETKSISSSLATSNTQSYSRSDTANVELHIESGYEPGANGRGTAETGFFFTGALTAGYTFQATSQSETATQQAYERSLSTDREVTRGFTVEREVQGAVMQVTVDLRNLSSLAYRMQNIQVTAFIQDPQDQSRLTPVATLLPDAEPSDGYTLGPLASDRGPFIFSNTTIVPGLVEALMANGSGLVFRLSNYDIIDERGRNFAFTGQEIIERTSRLVVDYGGASSLRALVSGEPFDEIQPGDETEIHRVATSGGRATTDTNGDGKIDRFPRELFDSAGDSLGIDYNGDGLANADDDDYEPDTVVVFDGSGKEVGIGLHQALAAVGLRRYEETSTPTANLTDEEILSSYSTVVVAGREKIYRIRGISNDSLNRKFWEILTPLGIDQITDLNDLVLKSNVPVSLNFVQDLDGDGLTADVEYFLRTSDSDLLEGGVPRGRDTDRDGLDDRFEALIGWSVSTPQKTYKVWPSAKRSDSNFDGLSDGFVAPGGWNDANGNGLRDRFNEVFQLPGPPTDWVLDPIRRDTDSDGINDAEELAGFVIIPLTGAAPYTRITNPLNPDTDGDTFGDGFERQVGLDPTDPDDIDSDGDGLPDPVEDAGWLVTTIGVSTAGFQNGAPTAVVRTSNKFDDDSDDDGLSDFEEFFLTTNARAADTDGDGIEDRTELLGFALGHKVGDDDIGIIKTLVLDADTDNDKRSDGAEAELVDVELARWVVRVDGDAPYRVFSNPLVADADFDSLVDGDEFAFDPLDGSRHTDPNNGNTDGDRRADGVEVRGGTNPLAVDLRVTVVAETFEASEAGQYNFELSVRKPDQTGVAGLSTTQTPVFTSLTGSSTTVGKVRINAGALGYVGKLSYRYIVNGLTLATGEEGDHLAFQDKTYNPGAAGVPAGATFWPVWRAVAGNTVEVSQRFVYSSGETVAYYTSSGTTLGVGFDFQGLQAPTGDPQAFPLSQRSVSFGLAENERFSIEGFATRIQTSGAKTVALGGLEGLKAKQDSTTGSATEVRSVFSWSQVADKFIEEFYFETTINGATVKLKFYYIIE
jgi:hypothetical protein